MTSVLNVVVADDHPLLRHGLRQLLEQIAGHRVVAEADNGAQAVAAVREHRPDLVVMDLLMPGMSGLDAIRAILGERPETAVLVLTMSDEDASVFAALRAGARGYVVKGCEPGEFLRAVEAVAAGETLLGAAVAARIGAFLDGSANAAAQAAFPALTAREREILELVARGRTNAQIAARLYLSIKTVKNHLTAIFAKLQVADRAQAIVQARQAGLGEG